MPLFNCEHCGERENTALGSFWLRKTKLCSYCATGEWHGKFERQTPLPATRPSEETIEAEVELAAVRSEREKENHHSGESE